MKINTKIFQDYMKYTKIALNYMCCIKGNICCIELAINKIKIIYTASVKCRTTSSQTSAHLQQISLKTFGAIRGNPEAIKTRQLTALTFLIRLK